MLSAIFVDRPRLAIVIAPGSTPFPVSWFGQIYGYVQLGGEPLQSGNVVGVLQGNGVVAGLKKAGTYGSHPVVASLWGGQEDANSFLFKGGVDQVLNPLYKNGTLTKGPQQFVPGWDNQKAGTIFNQMLIQKANKIDAVAAANDGLANAVVTAS